MRRLGLTICLLVGSFLQAALVSSASAGDWRFRRSYFSHHVPPECYAYDELPRSRSAYRIAYPNRLPGFSVQGAFRFNRIQINSGQSSDTMILQEGWFQER